MYLYEFFNHIFSCNIRLPLPMCEKNITRYACDAYINFLNDSSVFELIRKNIEFQISPNSYKVVGGYYIEKCGNCFFVADNSEVIYVFWNTETNKENSIDYLLGAVLPLYLHIKEFPQFHASMLEIGNDRSIMILGKSGNGKSTLAYEFFKSGYKILADDHSYITRCKGDIYCNFSYPLIKLFDNQVNNMNEILFKSIDKSKYWIDTSKSIPAKQDKLIGIFVIDFDRLRSKELQVVRCEDRETIQLLVDYNYLNFPYFNDMRLISACRDIARRVPIYKVSFGTNSLPKNIVQKFLDITLVTN